MIVACAFICQRGVNVKLCLARHACSSCQRDNHRQLRRSTSQCGACRPTLWRRRDASDLGVTVTHRRTEEWYRSRLMKISARYAAAALAAARDVEEEEGVEDVLLSVEGSSLQVALPAHAVSVCHRRVLAHGIDAPRSTVGNNAYLGTHKDVVGSAMLFDRSSLKRLAASAPPCMPLQSSLRRASVKVQSSCASSKHKIMSLAVLALLGCSALGTAASGSCFSSSRQFLIGGGSSRWSLQVVLMGTLSACRPSVAQRAVISAVLLLSCPVATASSFTGGDYNGQASASCRYRTTLCSLCDALAAAHVRQPVDHLSS